MAGGWAPRASPFASRVFASAVLGSLDLDDLGQAGAETLEERRLVVLALLPIRSAWRLNRKVHCLLRPAARIRNRAMTNCSHDHALRLGRVEDSVVPDPRRPKAA